MVFIKTKNADGSYSVSADIKKNSITEEYLQPHYLTDIKAQAASASASAQAAGGYADNAAYDAKLAQSYAVSGSGVREGENTDNAKYYSELAKQHEDKIKQLVDNQTDILAEVDKKLGLVEFSIDGAGNLDYNDNSGYNFSVNDDGELTWEVA